MQGQLDALSRQVEKLSAIVEQQSRMIRKQQDIIETRSRVRPEMQAESPSERPAAWHQEIGEKKELTKITMVPSPKIESAESPYSFQPFGRVHLDATHFEDDKKDHPGNTNFRRARLGFKGTLGEDISYAAEFDFAKEDVSFKNVSLTYTGLENTDLRIGHFKPVLGFDNNTSSNYIPFIERSSANNAFARGERIGAGAFFRSAYGTLSGGVFGEDAGSTGTADDEGVSADLRGSYHTGTETEGLFHIGLGGSWRNPSGAVRFSARPAGIGDNMVDTGNITGVDSVRIGAVEAASVFGPFSFQGEYFYTYLDRENAGHTDFDGYYVQGGYFLTGEMRPYNRKSGNFGRVKPRRPFDPSAGNWGAFELTGRYDALDLNDGDSGITGGTMENYTLGLNWHLTDYIRFMGNVAMVDTDDHAVTADDDPVVFNFRTQWDF